MPLLWEPRSHSWRQGTIIPADLPGLDLNNPSLDPPLGAGDLLVLISQDCDICCRSFEDEPDLEILVARRLPSLVPDGNLSHGKNPRKLQMTIKTSDGETVYAFSLRERRWISRSLLAGSDRIPSGQVGAKDLPTLTRWMARRYLRIALPTEFNDRTAAQWDQITKGLKLTGKLVDSIHLRLNPMAELPPQDSYSIDVVLLINSGECDDPSADTRVLKLVQLFETELGGCSGVELGQIEALLPRDVTLEEVSNLLRWDDPEYLSFKAGTPDAKTPNL